MSKADKERAKAWKAQRIKEHHETLKREKKFADAIRNVKAPWDDKSADEMIKHWFDTLAKGKPKKEKPAAQVEETED